MKIFTVGPVAMYPETFEISGVQTPYFRTPAFSKLMKESEQAIYQLLNAPSGAKTVFLTTSGTGAMEATLINVTKKDDKFLIISGGTFGERWAQLCEIHGVHHESLLLDFDETLTEAHLAPYKNKGFTGLLVNLHETSTGQLYDAQMLSRFCQSQNLLFIIDAISSFLADPIDMTAIKADAIIFSSHKAMALNPGLSMVTISPALYESRIKGAPVKVLYMDFNAHIDNLKNGQTPFTPAVNVALCMHDALMRIVKSGLSDKINVTKTLAHDFREKIQTIPQIQLPSTPQSNALTTLIFKNNDALNVHHLLQEKYCLMVTPNGGALANTVLRIGHIGNHTLTENDEIVAALTAIYSEE